MQLELTRPASRTGRARSHSSDGGHGSRRPILSDLEDELRRLRAKYPGQVEWFPRNRTVLFYSTDRLSILRLRIPHDYPELASPKVISAVTKKVCLRGNMVDEVDGCNIANGILDLVEHFVAKVQAVKNASQCEFETEPRLEKEPNATTRPWPTPHTRIIRLRHLTAGQSKHATNPSTGISGLTRVGRPGVYIFAGHLEDVDSHVNELRKAWEIGSQTWEVRFYSNAEAWSFDHGPGVVEFASMKDVLADLDDYQQGVLRRAINSDGDEIDFAERGVRRGRDDIDSD